MRDSVTLYINGERHSFTGEALFQSLSDLLRYGLSKPGTKVVCAEGDCGACAVLLGRIEQGKICYKSVNSCIQYVYQLDCTHIITVEGLKYDGQLNPVQECMVNGHGAQCGYCTPGFIVSICGIFEAGGDISPQRVKRDLTGNLCRCTGYDPIIKATCHVNKQHMRPIEALYPSQPILDTLLPLLNDPVSITFEGKAFYKPVTLAQATMFRVEHPGCHIIAGGTDLGVVMNKGKLSPTHILSMTGLTDLREIAITKDQISVGANATLSELEKVADQYLPEFGRMLWRHGSPLIRAAATLAGNVANGSPIGDTMPALYVLNGTIELTGQKGSRLVNINDFYTGYRKTVIAGDEIITRINIPIPKVHEILKIYKISKRWDMDISTFTAAIWMTRNDTTITDIRIAFGGVGANIIRLTKTEKQLKNQPFTEDTFTKAGATAKAEITPISDVRGSADYRLTLAENILLKMYHELTGSSSIGDNTLYDPQPLGK